MTGVVNAEIAIVSILYII